MSYTFKERRLASCDGKNTLHVEMYIPSGEVRAVVQLAHGMIDYAGRYEALGAYLAEHGIALIGNDHLGHGKTAACAEDLGFFGDVRAVAVIVVIIINEAEIFGSYNLFFHLFLI